MIAPRISLVVAIAKNGVIGRNGGLPWRLSSDLKRFKAMTMGKPVIMGRKTWDSLPVKPLPGRHNIVITRDRSFHAEGALIVGSPEMALALAEREGPEEICIIGGGEIFTHFLPRADRLYLTVVDTEPEGDTQFPAYDESEWMEVGREHVPAGPKDSASFTLRTLDRRTPTRHK
jgi:dihydrofolate reductase